MSRRDAKINEMRQHIDRLEIELESMKDAKEKTQARLNNASEESSVGEVLMCCGGDTA